MGKFLNSLVKVVISGKIKNISSGKSGVSLAEAQRKCADALNKLGKLADEDPEARKELIRLGLWSDDDDDDEHDTNSNDQNS